MTAGRGRSLLILLAGVLVGGLATAVLLLTVGNVVAGETPANALDAPVFVDESETDGIDQVYAGEFQFFVGGGVAVFDCNDDLLPDLYIAGGTDPGGLYVNRSDVGGQLRFDRIAAPVTDLTHVTGAYPIDVDSDGIADLAVLRVGENLMLRGTGDCGFVPANDQWGVDGGDQWTTAFSAKWESGESLPTLAFGNYLASESGDRDECADHALLQPNGMTYQKPTALSPGWCTLSILFSDWSRRGTRDLRMTNDRHYYRDGQEQMWQIDAGRPPLLYTDDEGWRSMKIWGMGIATHDLTGDGLSEVFLTSQGDNKLQTLGEVSGRPEYEDMALAVGATAHRPFSGDTNRPSTAWHPEFGDVNNDGFIDLFVTKGNVDAQPDFALDDPNNLLIGQPDGTFREGAAEADLVDYARSRGGALADLNLDGLLDVVVVERREPAKVWRNTGDAGNWLAVDVRQPPPNPDAIGAWVELRMGDSTITSELTVGGGHAGGELGPLHFGIGQETSVELRVIWPDREEGPWMSAAANQIVAVDRGSKTVSPLISPLIAPQD